MNQKRELITSTARGPHLKEATHRLAMVSRHLKESKYRETSQDRLALIVQKKAAIRITANFSETAILRIDSC